MSEERNPYYPIPKYTPAPWYVYSNELIDGTKTFWIGNSADVVFDCSTYGPKELFFPPNEPDARLICAAPEMLEALEMVIAFEDWERYSHPDHKDALQYAEVVDRVRSAIAKAKGGQP